MSSSRGRGTQLESATQQTNQPAETIPASARTPMTSRRTPVALGADGFGLAYRWRAVSTISRRPGSSGNIRVGLHVGRRMIFVLVPGGWHGGWSYTPLANALRQHGHDACPVTLTGVGDRNHLLTATTNLDTHINDVTAMLESERITDAVLVGHSYAGMVITGVADRVPERVATLVYSDAYVPDDGQSCFELTSAEFRRMFVEGRVTTDSR
ncbi:alpha/beta fold hydrolase [Nocardia jiangxiensis]|uniref:Alpha/beta fold hydrolase n=1 Tax=Nocardia jiangxiensis TaxID=282685 RepID=A0ABW6SBN1_9NOCA